jgi:GNAT superfamily N-acetyltransferase
MPLNPQIVLQEITAITPESTLLQARSLLLEYGRFVIAQPGVTGFCFGSLEQEAARLPHSYIEQGGGCLLAQEQGQPLGFIAWRSLPPPVAPQAWELKRLWVRPSGRGARLGFSLTQAVLDRAIAAGINAVYLDTVADTMTFAYRLYLEMGFQPCSQYNDNPVEGITYMRKSL